MIRTSIALTASAFMAGVFATVAVAGDAPVATGQVADQTFLMDANKMTLYTFDKDEAGKSNCYDQCAVNWPPLTAAAGTDLPRNYSLIQRDDGTMQVAYKGQPLYLWIKDKQPGDMTGDGVKGVWHTARP